MALRAAARGIHRAVRLTAPLAAVPLNCSSLLRNVNVSHQNNGNVAHLPYPIPIIYIPLYISYLSIPYVISLPGVPNTTITNSKMQ
jgi:hypothetical protein